VLCKLIMLISAPRSLLFLSLTLSVYLLSVCLSQTLLLLFCFSMESSHFWPSVLHDKKYKTISSIFDLGPLTPKIYSPTFSSVGHWVSHSLWVNDIWARRGDPVAYRLVFFIFCVLCVAYCQGRLSLSTDGDKCAMVNFFLGGGIN